MDGGGAYGAGKATGRAFDVLTFVRKPQVILRAVSWVSHLISPLPGRPHGGVVYSYSWMSPWRPRYRRRTISRWTSLSFDAAVTAPVGCGDHFAAQ